MMTTFDDDDTDTELLSDDEDELGIDDIEDDDDVDLGDLDDDDE